MAKRKVSRPFFPEIKEEELEQRIIDIARVTRVMAGGKRLSFRACVVLGNKKGLIGYAIGKGKDVAEAINKAQRKAKQNMIKVKMIDGTIPHEIKEKFGAAKVLLKPAPKGTGVRAGGPIRAVLEVAGLENVVSKMLGSKNKINNVHAVFKALSQLKLPEEYKALKEK